MSSFFITDKEEVRLGRIVATIISVGLVIMLIFGSFFIVGPGERGIVVRLGAVQPALYGEGLHGKMPFIDGAVIMDVRTQKEQVNAAAASKDLQVVTSTIALNYHVKEGSVSILYQKIGGDYKARIIDPAIQEAVKASTAKYNAEELISKRELVREDIRNLLLNRLDTYHVVVDDLNIVNFDFSADFNNAIEAKVTAEQQALKAQNDLERIKIEKEQKITQAEAEAQSIKIQSEALKQNQDILKLRWIEKWDGHMPKVISGDNDLLVGVDSLVAEED